ncbi:hypothetical protein QYF36_010003 [Acer negundo]|nr:hypothetical protein QYF36_010003 [Acer negundo]
MCSKELYMKLVKQGGKFTEESIAFKKKILERSGIGDMTYGPEGLMQIPPIRSMVDARKETESVIVGAIDEFLAKTGVKPRDIGILVVNSSLFNPTPSLSAMVVNRYKLRGNILSYNLCGMGCSAGIISIDLAKQLLQIHPNSYALVVSTENIVYNLYEGNERSMLVTNCLFRVGSAAILLSNRPSDRGYSKNQLVHSIRTHKGADDKSYNCVMQREDDNNKIGVSLSKDLMLVAGDALKTNITTLGPLVLPMSVQLLFFTTLVTRKIFKMKIKPYIPDFKLAFEHFVYTSLWYELAYSEAKGRIRKADRTWQIAFGSGFKCNSAMWRALRTINPAQEKNPWTDEIDNFPVRVPKFESIAV